MGGILEYFLLYALVHNSMNTLCLWAEGFLLLKIHNFNQITQSVFISFEILQTSPTTLTSFPFLRSNILTKIYFAIKKHERMPENR